MPSSGLAVREANVSVLRDALRRGAMGPGELDGLVECEARRIWADLDCRACANCCKALHVWLDEQDIARLAEGLGMTVDEVRRAYLEEISPQERQEAGLKPAADPADVRAWRFQSPCPLLTETGCGVYPFRPKTCRDYPYLDQPDQADQLGAMADRAADCPLVDKVLADLAQRVSGPGQYRPTD